jgi:HEPN domain-containing protein
LDVYGDVLSPLSLTLETTLAQATIVLRELASLNSAIFNLYISYVLSKAGFYYEPLASDEFKEKNDRKLHTDEFKDEDWIEHWRLFGKKESEPPVMSFLNRKNAAHPVLKVKSIHFEFQGEETPEIGHPRVVWSGFTKEVVDELAGSYKAEQVKCYVVHPAISRLAKDDFRETKKQLAYICGADVFLSTGEFRVRFVPQDEMSSFQEKWPELREKMKSEFQKAWPVIALSKNAEILRRASEDLRKASLEYEEKEFTNCIRDAAYACESLLAVLYQRHGRFKSASEKKLTFDDYLTQLKAEVEEDFGEDTMSDLCMVRDARNRHSHPGEPSARQEEAWRVLRRAQLFQEFFKMKMSA